MIIDGRFEHNHAEPDNRTVQRLKVRQECKRKATDESGERPNKMIMGEIARQDSTELVPEDVKSVRQAIYRRRRKTQPKLPQTREETHEALHQYVMFSGQDEKVIHINNSETNIIMFSTETNLKFLSEPDIHLFADGTFQYCPKFYYQLYTIHAFRNGQYIPCAFFLLPDKTKQTYINMLQHLVQSCSQSGVNMDISVLQCFQFGQMC
jgi:hypothetical protein